MVIRRVAADTTHFLNVDLDIHSKEDLQPLVAALGKRVLVLFAGRVRRTYQAHLEVTKLTTTPDATIRALCALVRALPKAERSLWDRAKLRDFSIGLQPGTKPNSMDFPVGVEAVKAVAELNARIVVTIYAPVRSQKTKR